MTKDEIQAKVYAALRITEKDDFKAGNQYAMRTIGIGLGVACSRCGGSGEYSFNLMYGTTCFKCNGRKFLAPKITKKLLAQIEEAVAAGKLDEYFTQVKRHRQALGATDIVMAAWNRTGISDMYNWFKAAGGEEPHRAIADINKKMHDAYERVSKLSHKLIPRHKNITAEQVEALIQATNQAVAEIEQAALELEPYR